MAEIVVGGRPVGDEHPCFVIAEAGVNHGCDLAVAKEMIRRAKAAGADAIKFQTYKADTLVTRWAPRYWDDPEPSGTQYAIFRQIDKMEPPDYVAMAEHCREQGILFVSTPFDLPSVDLLGQLEVPAFKVASADLTDYPLLERIAEYRRPILLSTGASWLREIRESVEFLASCGAREVALLHCVLCYPTPVDQLSLLRLRTLKDEFPDLVVGLSDHTIPDECVTTTSAAVALGARIVEKHFTLDRSQEGPDHPLSLDPDLLEKTVRAIRLVESALGDPEIVPLECELPARQYARRSIIAAVTIPKGTRLIAEHLIMKRPGTGIPPTRVQEVLGRVTRREIEADAALDWSDLE